MGKKRKTRSDKKRDVKPTVPIELKDNIYRASRLCNMPVKNFAEELCRKGNGSNEVTSQLSPYFVRDVRLSNTVYFGREENEKPPRPRVLSERLSIRFVRQDYQNIELLAYTMSVTPSFAAALLLDKSIRNPAIINELLSDRMDVQSLSENDKLELKKLMKFIRKNNPYEEYHSWGEYLKIIAFEVGDFVVNGWRKE